MNELDYGSLEACKKLAENGIVLNTKEFWYRYGDKWEDGPRIFIVAVERMPRPSMTELWRELPEDGETIVNMIENFTGYGKDFPVFLVDFCRDINQIAELLIWYKKKRREEIEKKLLKHAENLKW